MKWLSAVAKHLKTAAGFLRLFGGTIKQYTPDNIDKIVDQATDLSTKYSEIIVGVEAGAAVFGMPGDGAHKLEAAIPHFAEAIAQTDALKSRKIANRELYMQGVRKQASGWADILNSLDPGEIELPEDEAPADAPPAGANNNNNNNNNNNGDGSSNDQADPF
jgi:hypothetical protein